MLDQLQQTLTHEVPDLLADHQVPGVAIGVHQAGAHIGLGFGVTNLDHPLPVTADTIFQVGSISKTFLGIIAAQLEHEHRLDLNEPIAPIVRDAGRVDPRITMSQLLTHTAGIDAQYMIGEARALLADHADDSIQASLRHLEREDLMFEPGSDFSYSGPGFMVAAAVIERITGMAWADVLRERILIPAGMTQTFTRADEVITHRVAAPHDIAHGQARVARDQGWQLHWQLPGWDVPGGGILSTANELLTYAQYACQTAPSQGFFRTLANRGVPGQDIAYAWKQDTRRGRMTVGHDGLTIGYSSRLSIVPTDETTYTILTNSVAGNPLKNAIERLLLDSLFGPAPRPTLSTSKAKLTGYASLEGVYDCGFYGHVRLRMSPDERSFDLTSVPRPRADGRFTIEPMAIPHLVPAGSGILASDPGAELPEHVVAYACDEHGQATALRIGERLATKVA